MKYYKEVYELTQNNKERLQHNFQRLLANTTTLNATKDYVQSKIYDWNNNKSFAFLILEKSTHQLIGHFNIKDIFWKGRQCELSYFIDINHEGKGLMTEAMNLIVKYCFRHLQLQHILVRILSDNESSRKMVEKCGFKYEGAFYNQSSIESSFVTAMLRYGLSKEEYDKNNL